MEVFFKKTRLDKGKQTAGIAPKLHEPVQLVLDFDFKKKLDHP